MIRTTWLAAALLLALALPAVAGVEGQTTAEPDDDVVVWRAGERLTWTDFRADPSGRFAARSSWTWTQRDRVAVSCAQEGDGWACAARHQTIEIETLFLKNLSWVRPGFRNPSLLAHEQGHFDLAEVYARRLEAALRALQAGAAGAERVAAEDAALADFDARALDAYARWLDDALAAQDRYERETEHGADAAAQARWEARIRAWLAGSDG